MVSWAAVVGIARAALDGKWLYHPSKLPEAGKTSFLKSSASSFELIKDQAAME